MPRPTMVSLFSSSLSLLLEEKDVDAADVKHGPPRANTASDCGLYSPRKRIVARDNDWRC
ncbi:hypothetical protein [Pyrofollis japonicus]|uniref:hypothetical protein n=1 Tax=Pyrofollis japonicus TaxID=3060460 RepID=UPI00295BE090|nr:hypothetical protein [Pyrofollis japonicus]